MVQIDRHVCVDWARCSEEVAIGVAAENVVGFFVVDNGGTVGYGP